MGKQKSKYNATQWFLKYTCQCIGWDEHKTGTIKKKIPFKEMHMLVYTSIQAFSPAIYASIHIREYKKKREKES